MPILNKSYEAYERPGIVVSYRVSNVKIFKGAAVGLNAAGHLVPMAHGTAGLRFVGVANDSMDNSAGSAGSKSVNVTKTGSFVFIGAAGFAPAQADVGKEVYANTDWEFQIATAGLTNQYKVGTITALESSSIGTPGIRVRIDNYTV